MQPNLNITLQDLMPSATLAINQKSLQLQREGIEITRLGLGQSPFPVPPIVVQALKDHAHEKDYLPVLGLPQLREAVARHLSASRGVIYAADNIMIGPGSKELLFILQLAFNSELLLPSPSWVSYAPQAQLLGLPVSWLPTTIQDGWRLQPQLLDDFCTANGKRNRLLILNYPNNPAGTSYSALLLSELAEVARKHQLLLVADEIYWELSFADNSASLAQYYPEGTIISTGLSKWCGAGGWRLGALAIPDTLSWLRDAMAIIASETFSAVSAPVQYAAVTAFTGHPEVNSYLDNSRKVMKIILDAFVDTLQSSGVSCAFAEGGFYLLPDFSSFREPFENQGIYDGKALADRLLQDTGIASLEGSNFGLPSSSLTLRFALVDFDGGAALHACDINYSDKKLDIHFLNDYAEKINLAALKIVDWLSEYNS